MTDIVEELEALGIDSSLELRLQAAAEITRLRTAISRATELARGIDKSLVVDTSSDLEVLIGTLRMDRDAAQREAKMWRECDDESEAMMQRAEDTIAEHLKLTGKYWKPCCAFEFLASLGDILRSDREALISKDSPND